MGRASVAGVLRVSSRLCHFRDGDLEEVGLDPRDSPLTFVRDDESGLSPLGRDLLERDDGIASI